MSGWARLLVQVASWLAPAHLRADWRAEWEAELWHESLRTDDDRKLTMAALSAFRDAIAHA